MDAASTRSSTSPGPAVGTGRSIISAPGPARTLASARIVSGGAVAVIAASIGSRLRSTLGQPGGDGVVGDPWLLVDDWILDRPDPVDLAAHDVAAHHVARGLGEVAHARRRAGRDQVAGVEGDRARGERDQRDDVEDHLGGARVLPGLAVDR